MSDMINIVHPDTPGRTYSIPAESLPDAIAQGFKPEGGGQAAERVGEAAAEDSATSASGKLGAAATAGLAGITGGASDLLFRGAKELRERNPGLSLAANLAGGLASGGLVGKVGEAAGGLIEGGGALAKIGRAAASSTAEGATIGAGQGVSELALSDDPLTLEHAASVLSSNMLFGGAIGGGVGTLGKSAELGLQRAKTTLDGVANRASAIAGVPEDLAALDAKGLRAARDAELDNLAAIHTADRATAKSAAVDDVLAYQDAIKSANPYLVTGEGPASAPFAKSSKALRNALDDVQGLRESPNSLAKPLRIQAKAIEDTLAAREAIATKFEAVNARIADAVGEDLATLPDSATHIELDGKAAKRYAAFADVKIGKGGVLSVAREDAATFLEALKNGEVHGQGQQAMDKLQGLLDQNRELQTKLKTATGPTLPRSELTSDRLASIDVARDALAAPGAKKTLAEEMLGGTVFHQASSIMGGLVGSIPLVGGLLGPLAGGAAARGVQELVFGRLGKAATEAARKTSSAIDLLLGVGDKIGKPVASVATRTLGAVRYAAADAGEKPHADLASVYKARANEIKAQTMFDMAGNSVMRPEARTALAARISPIRAVSPVIADRIETLAARRLEYLSSKLPRRPDFGLPIGDDNWQPSDFAMRSFARHVDAAENPDSVEHRLAAGQITPEDVEAYHANYPERAAALVQQVMVRMTEMRKLPYQKRLALTMFTGKPIDPSMHPVVLNALQSSFASEEGSEGGTQAPTAQPQFGSVSKSPDLAPTPAQQRSQG